MEMEIDVDAIVGVLVVTVRGEFVGAAVEQSANCLRRSFGGGRPVVVDLVAVEQLPVVALRALLDAHARLGTRLRVVVGSARPAHLALKQAGLADVLALHDASATALASVGLAA